MQDPNDDNAHADRVADRGRAAREAGVTVEMIDHLVRTFYARVRDDAELGPIFVQTLGPGDWEPHLVKLVQFWSSVMLATASYHGRPIPAHARLPELQPRHFPIWLDHFRRTAAEVAPSDAARIFVERAEKIAASMMMVLANGRGPGWTAPV